MTNMEEFAPLNEKPTGNAAGMVLPLVLFLVAVYFWDSAIVLPIKYLTVFFHELSHGLAAVFTGGSIVRIELNANQGGVCWTTGGIRFIVISAGYLGSLLWGCLILLGAVKTRFDQQITAGLGVLLLGVTLIWVRNLEGIIICVLTGFGLLALAAYSNEKICDQFLKFLGLTSCFYVLIDIKEDLIDRSVRGSDAYKIGEMLFMPDWLVGIVWLLIAGFVTWKVLAYSLKE
ncbi:MAG TPA: M50 family metallopeptidase [Candidatus Ozemobacteraceae bacterium]|nr:M50 family metallopeptidase [Candidatus Ozemobacteraceae bacterium]